MGNLHNLLRIGVFYDGQYFYHVSNYYKHEHKIKQRISIEGLHRFIRSHVAELCTSDKSDNSQCQIVDAHYFRGRMSARDAKDSPILFAERQFDEVLMNENVVTHYMPLKTTFAGQKQEKGIDVWLALEAYELAIYKRFDILVLIACDGDYVPLVRKLNTLGTRVMLLSWDFDYVDSNGNQRSTRTSQQLLEEVTYPVSMFSLINSRIDDRVKGKEFVSQLFPSKPAFDPCAEVQSNNLASGHGSDGTDPSKVVHTSTICHLKEEGGFGFISDPQNNNDVFFHYSHLENCDFDDLQVGQKVEYTATKNLLKDGKLQAVRVRKLS